METNKPEAPGRAAKVIGGWIIPILLVAGYVYYRFAMDPRNDTETCEALIPRIQDIVKDDKSGQYGELASITEVSEVPGQADPPEVEGKLLRNCKGTAQFATAGKMRINFYASEASNQFYFGFHEIFAEDCQALVPKVIAVSKEAEHQDTGTIIALQDVAEIKGAPARDDVPGVMAKDCVGTAFFSSSGKQRINFYATKGEDSVFYGFVRLDEGDAAALDRLRVEAPQSVVSASSPAATTPVAEAPAISAPASATAAQSSSHDEKRQDFSGVYESGDGDVTITHRGNRIGFAIDTVFEDRTCSLNGDTELLDGNRARWASNEEDDRCVVQFELNASSVQIETSECSLYCGLNASMDGVYKRKKQEPSRPTSSGSNPPASDSVSP